MPLNLITDAWIPVVDKDGKPRVIAPWQMADASIVRPNWPRPDFNIACYELLIGLVFMADPPSDEEDWGNRMTPDCNRLKEELEPYADAFNLTGDGPLFMQDFEALADNDPNLPDMLFIDSAGESTAKKNKDLMVHRERYKSIKLPFAAMALFTFQSFAPKGGRGHRTSMRGGGPMVTLVDPQKGLWSLIWANVPDGQPSDQRDFSWLAPSSQVHQLRSSSSKKLRINRLDGDHVFNHPIPIN